MSGVLFTARLNELKSAARRLKQSKKPRGVRIVRFTKPTETYSSAVRAVDHRLETPLRRLQA